MSEREKKLVTLFGIAGLILLIFWGYSFYQNKSNALKQDRIKAENNLRDGKLYLASRDAILDEIDWPSSWWLPSFRNLPTRRR
jgi:hypothetical protein